MRPRYLQLALVVFTALALFPASAFAFTEPDQIYSHNGLLQTTFVAHEGTAMIDGKKISGAITINGKFPSPTLNVKAGDTVRIKFVNRLTQVTNIHFHGMHVSPAGNGDNIFRRFAPGKTYNVEIKIPHDHPNGLYWYHPHLHGLVNSQVLRGYAGLISVSGGTDRLPMLAPFKQRQMALNLTQFTTNGKSIVDPNDQNDATAITAVNGKLGQRITMRPGQTELWRIANMSNEAFYKLKLDGHSLWIVGQDGHPVRSSRKASSVLLAPGSRYELLVRAGSKTGDFKFRQVTDTDGFNTFPNQDLLTLHVAGAKIAQRRIPQKIRAFDSLANAKVTNKRKWILTFSPDNAPVFKALINDRTFDPSRVDSRARLGGVEEWTFINRTTQDHPIHLHTNAFQVVKINNVVQHPNSPIDNAILPRLGSITIRFKPLTFTGMAVFHCHILFHEDSGMMATIRWEKGAGKANVIEPEGAPSVADEQVRLSSVVDPAMAAAVFSERSSDAHSHVGHRRSPQGPKQSTGSIGPALKDLFCDIPA
jgi:FtsP/CotA-like multicopper oxidase with cupredoxin domain